ncbi:MAG: hypothetical protein ACE5FH_09550, partial [Candidatus Zixiibacteriota bacterium]
MRRTTYIVMASVFVLFAVSWIVKAMVLSGSGDDHILQAFLVTISVFLTLCIFSFLYQDNPYYKFAEHLFVGVSAAYWMCQAFWTTIVGNLFPRISRGLSEAFGQQYQPGDLNFFYWIPVILGILLLMRLSPKGGWLSRWPLAFIVGTTAGLNFVRYLRSDFVVQVSSTFVPLLGKEPHQWSGVGSFFSHLSLSASGQLIAIAT